MKTRSEIMFTLIASFVAFWISIWFFTHMTFLNNAILLSAPPGDIGTMDMPVYSFIEMLFGRYYLHIFILLFSFVFLVGTLQAIWTLGENMSIIIKAGSSTLVTQLFVSGYEMVMILKRRLDIPTDIEGNVLNVVGYLWIYPVEWFGVNMTLVGMGLLAVIAFCIICQFLFNYDFFGHRLAPLVHSVDNRVKKKLSTPPLLAKVVDKTREYLSRQGAGTLQEDRMQGIVQQVKTEEVDAQPRMPSNSQTQTGIVSEIPVLTDVVTNPFLQKSDRVITPRQSENKEVVVTEVVTKTINSTTDMIRDGLLTLGLGFDNLRLVDGPFIWRFSMTPATASIGQDKIWREAEKELARLMRVNTSDVSFEVAGGEYVYSVNKPPQQRTSVLFSDLIRGRIQREEGIKFPLLLGIDTEGKPVQKCAFGLQDLLIVGKKGSGKSSLLHSILIYQMLWSLKFKVPVSYYISDVNGATAMKYSPLQGSFIQMTASSHLESVKMLEHLASELKERVALLKQYKCQHITSANKHLLAEGKSPKPIVFIVLEEVGMLFSDKVTRERMGSLIAGIVTTGRKYGVFFYSVGTFATKGMFGTTGNNSGKALIEESTKMAFHLDSARDAATFGGANFPAEKLVGVGDALLKQGGTVQRIHTPVFDKDFAKNDASIDKYIAFIASKK
jgi:hypothetical protein